MVSTSEKYRRHRFPIEVVEHCVWLYFRFALSYRNVEEMMAERGVQLTYETVREWCQKFGALYAARLRRRRVQIGSKWHLDEVFLKINGVLHYLWRAVDQHGATIDILVQPRRDRWAALRFFRKLLRTAASAPRVVVTDKLRSYAAAKRCILPEVEHRQSRYLNNRIENSHQPTRIRERQRKRFRSRIKRSSSSRSSSHSTLPSACAGIFSRHPCTDSGLGALFTCGTALPSKSLVSGHLIQPTPPLLQA